MNRIMGWIGLAGALLAAFPAAAQVPSAFNYQGRLLDGTNLVNGSRDIIVRLYTTASGGSAVYNETNLAVAVVDGLYSFQVGDDATGLSTALTNSTLYLELQVATQTLSPRERLTASAYSLLAGGVQPDGVLSNMIASGAVAGVHVANGAITDAKISATAGIGPTKIAGTALTQSVTFGGDVSGFFNNLQLQPNSVGSGEVAINAIRSTHIADGQIVDGDISATANIGPIKISGTALTQSSTFSGDVGGLYNNLQIQGGSVSNGELAVDAVRSANILNGEIVDADVSPAAAIQGTKVQAGSPAARGTVQIAPGATGPLVIGQGAPELKAFGVVNTITAAAPNSAFFITGGSGVTITNLPGNTLRIDMGAKLAPIDNIVWVGTNGTPAGPGTIDQPFDTPQNGYNAAAAIYTNVPAAVVIAAGPYPGPLVMNAGNVHVIGMGRPVINGILQVVSPAHPALVGWQRVEGVVVQGRTQVQTMGSEAKFHNCRMNQGLDFWGSNAGAQDCIITVDSPEWIGTAAVTFGFGNEFFSTNLGLYNCSVQFKSSAPAVEIRPEVYGCELIGNEIVQLEMGPAIRDMQPRLILPLHLVSHNYIKGPVSNEMMPFPAIQDMGALTMAIHQNTIWGDVGTGGFPQYVAQNMVYGLIRCLVAPGVWATDGNGNTTYQPTPQGGVMPTLPDAWDD